MAADGDVANDTLPVPSTCVRRIAEVSIYSNKRTLSYITDYHDCFEELHRGGIISDAQYDIAREFLVGATHTLCVCQHILAG